MAVGCSDRQGAVGLANWAEVIRVTEAFMFREDTAQFLRHTDQSGIAIAEQRKIEQALRRVAARGVPKDYKLDRTEVLALEAIFATGGVAPEITREFAAMQWSRRPQKIIIYHFTDGYGSPARFYFGAFQKEGLWFFSVRYFK